MLEQGSEWSVEAFSIVTLKHTLLVLYCAAGQPSSSTSHWHGDASETAGRAHGVGITKR